MTHLLFFFSFSIIVIFVFLYSIFFSSFFDFLIREQTLVLICIKMQKKNLIIGFEILALNLYFFCINFHYCFLLFCVDFILYISFELLALVIILYKRCIIKFND